MTPIAHADTAEASKLLPHAEAHLSAHAFIGIAMCLALYELPDWVDGLISIGHIHSWTTSHDLISILHVFFNPGIKYLASS